MFVFVDEAIAAGRSDESKGQRVAGRVVGALMMRALSSLIAAVRAVWAPRRVDSSARSASRRPRARGTARSGRPRTSRAARRASRASVLAPSLVAAVRGWLNSITCSPAAPRCAHAPDP